LEMERLQLVIDLYIWYVRSFSLYGFLHHTIYNCCCDNCLTHSNIV
jgi:hypothetical protein